MRAPRGQGQVGPSPSGTPDSGPSLGARRGGWEWEPDLGSRVLSRDGNSTRGCGYPRILNPMDAGAGLIFHPWMDPHPHPHIAGADADLRFHPRVDPHPSGKKNHNPTYLDKVHLNYPNYKMST